MAAAVTQDGAGLAAEQLEVHQPLPQAQPGAEDVTREEDREPRQEEWPPFAPGRGEFLSQCRDPIWAATVSTRTVPHNPTQMPSRCLHTGQVAPGCSRARTGPRPATDPPRFARACSGSVGVKVVARELGLQAGCHGTGLEVKPQGPNAVRADAGP